MKRGKEARIFVAGGGVALPPMVGKKEKREEGKRPSLSTKGIVIKRYRVRERNSS